MVAVHASPGSPEPHRDRHAMMTAVPQVSFRWGRAACAAEGTTESSSGGQAGPALPHQSQPIRAHGMTHRESATVSPSRPQAPSILKQRRAPAGSVYLDAVTTSEAAVLHDSAPQHPVVGDSSGRLAGELTHASGLREPLGKGKPPIGPETHNLPGGSRGRPHYHVNGRVGPSHIFYGVASALTLSHYAEGSSPLVQGAAAVGDFFNPLSLPKDALDIYSMVKTMTTEKP